MRDRGCRRHADHGYGALRPLDPYRGMNVIMPVQDQLHAVPLQKREQFDESVSRLMRESERSG